MACPKRRKPRRLRHRGASPAVLAEVRRELVAMREDGLVEQNGDLWRLTPEARAAQERKEIGEELVAWMLAEGFIEPNPNPDAVEPYVTTPKGRAYAAEERRKYPAQWYPGTEVTQ